MRKPGKSSLVFGASEARKVDGKLALRANENHRAPWCTNLGLKDRLPFVVVAASTKLMLGFAALANSLGSIGESSRSNLVKLISFRLSFPLFKASHCFFKLAYSINQRELLRMSRQCRDVSVRERGQYLANLSIDGETIADVYRRIRYVQGCLEAANRSGDCTEVHDDSSPDVGRG